jgi:hypothetical protein
MDSKDKLVIVPSFAPETPVVLSIEEIEALSEEGLRLGRLFEKRIAPMKRFSEEDLKIRVR